MDLFGDPGAHQATLQQQFYRLEDHYGADAQTYWDDFYFRHEAVDMHAQTVKKHFTAPIYSDGSADVPASGDPNHPNYDDPRWIDPDSIAWIDREDDSSGLFALSREQIEGPKASNWMVVGKERSVTGRPLLVGGPQMEYIRPNMFMEFDARTVNGEFQMDGVSLPGLFIIAFSGAAHDAAWTPTAAGGTTSDLFVEKLCEGPPLIEEYRVRVGLFNWETRTREVPNEHPHYQHDGQCKPMIAADESSKFYTVHGPVIGEVGEHTVNGEKVALTIKSYNRENVANGMMPFYRLAKGHVTSGERFIEEMEIFPFAMNYVYADKNDIAFIKTGLYPIRAAGAQMDYPVWGTGEWDWQGLAPMENRPHVVNPPEGYLTSWNNQSAPGFYEISAYHNRVMMLEKMMEGNHSFDLASLAEVSQVAAVQDGYAVVFVPLLNELLAMSDDPRVTDYAPLMAYLNDWLVNDAAERVDLDKDEVYDSAGPTIMDDLIVALGERLASDMGGEIFAGGVSAEEDYDLPGVRGTAYQTRIGARIVMLLQRSINAGDDWNKVEAERFQCANGLASECAALVLDVMDEVTGELESKFASTNPDDWRGESDHIDFVIAQYLTDEGLGSLFGEDGMLLEGDGAFLTLLDEVIETVVDEVLALRGDPRWHWQNRPTYQQLFTTH
jgi:hypothetical protein